MVHHPRPTSDGWRIWPDRDDAPAVDLDNVKIAVAILGVLFGIPVCIGIAAFLVLDFGFWALGAALAVLLLAMWIVGGILDRRARRRLADEITAASARAAVKDRRALALQPADAAAEDLERRLAQDFRRPSEEQEVQQALQLARLRKD